MQVTKLIMVTGENNNKYYTMHQLDSNEFEAEWGRVDVTSTKKKYPMHRWNSTYKDKVNKGYKDVTDLFVEGGTVVDFKDLNDSSIKYIVTVLQAYAAKSVTHNYNVTAAQVTQKQIDTAQNILNEIAGSGKIEKVNSLLLELYSTIPRKMHKVQDHLLEKKVKKDEWDKFVGEQQDILDALSSQVSVLQQSTDTDNKNRTLLDALGIEIYTIDKEEESLIKTKLGENKNQFNKGFRISHKKSRDNYEKYVKNSKHKDCDLLWHGSRNENWWSIMQTGLLLRPTNAVITGKMFGYGIYFADKARKSIGYTSYRGSHWASGNDSKAYLSLFDVHVGKQLIVYDSDSGLNEDRLNKSGHDSTFAKAGRSLINNEYIIYNGSQCSIKFLVEII